MVVVVVLVVLVLEGCAGRVRDGAVSWLVRDPFSVVAVWFAANRAIKLVACV